jgi:hypothetical protein
MELHGWMVLTSMLMRATCRWQRYVSIAGSAAPTSTTSSITGSVTSGSKPCGPWIREVAILFASGGSVRHLQKTVAAPGPICSGLTGTMSPFEAMAAVATALDRLLKADDQTTIRQVIGDPETFRQAVAQLDVYLQCRPDHFDRRAVNARLRALSQPEGTSS